MFLIVKLILLPLWLPLKLIGELIEHSGRGRRRRHYRRRMRVAWTPGRAGLTRWTSGVMRAATASPGRGLRLVAVPFAVVAVFLVWTGLVYAWLLWWAVLAIALPLALLV